jgi:hypothetical protein
MMLASKLGEAPSIFDRLWIGERRLDFARPRERVSESIA